MKSTFVNYCVTCCRLYRNLLEKERPVTVTPLVTNSELLRYKKVETLHIS